MGPGKLRARVKKTEQLLLRGQAGIYGEKLGWQGQPIFPQARTSFTPLLVVILPVVGKDERPIGVKFEILPLL